MICNLCPRRCGALRDESNANGFCGMPQKIKIANYGLFKFEEPCISFGKGSGAIFFSGCNLACVFCQNHEISSGHKGWFVSSEELVNIFKKLEEMGAENINLVTPMHYALQILDALKMYKPKIPVVYNTNAYEDESIIKMLAPYIDIFLPDLKYYSNNLSDMFSGAKDYFDVAIKSIKLMRSLKQDNFDSNGKMLEGVLVRHMILPLCTDDSIKVLNVLKTEVPNTRVSLMAQYVPMHRASEFKAINRKITKREYNKVLDEYIRLGLDGYIQELTSADKCFIPQFDGED